MKESDRLESNPKSFIFFIFKNYNPNSIYKNLNYLLNLINEKGFTIKKYECDTDFNMKCGMITFVVCQDISHFKMVELTQYLSKDEMKLYCVVYSNFINSSSGIVFTQKPKQLFDSDYMFFNSTRLLNPVKLVLGEDMIRDIILDMSYNIYEMPSLDKLEGTDQLLGKLFVKDLSQVYDNNYSNESLSYYS